MNTASRRDISLRGTTYATLKARAKALGMSTSALAEKWIEEYAPFTDAEPAALQRTKKRKLPKERPVQDVHAHEAHPLDPVDPPVRERAPKPKLVFQPSVVVPPPTKPTPSGGGYTEF